MAVSLSDIKTNASTKILVKLLTLCKMVSAAKLGRSEEASRNFKNCMHKKCVTDFSGVSSTRGVIARRIS